MLQSVLAFSAVGGQGLCDIDDDAHCKSKQFVFKLYLKWCFAYWESQEGGKLSARTYDSVAMPAVPNLYFIIPLHTALNTDSAGHISTGAGTTFWLLVICWHCQSLPVLVTSIQLKTRVNVRLIKSDKSTVFCLKCLFMSCRLLRLCAPAT